MKTTNIYQIGLLVLLTISGVSINATLPPSIQFFSSVQADTSKIVASVDGTDIPLNRIQISPEQVKLRFFVRHKREATEQDKSALRTLKKSEEIKSVVAEIEGIIYAQQIKRFQITVSDKELQDEWHIFEKKNDVKEMEVQTKKQLSLLAKALKEVYENGKNPDKVYKELLSSTMSFIDWKVDSNYYKSSERRKMLETYLDKKDDDLSKPFMTLKGMVAGKKLNDAIDKQLAKDDPKFAQFKKVLPDDSMLALQGQTIRGKKSRAYDYIRHARAGWWRKLYRKAHVTILDKNYRSALKILRADPVSTKQSPVENDRSETQQSKTK